jgi:hypothetical protein
VIILVGGAATTETIRRVNLSYLHRPLAALHGAVEGGDVVPPTFRLNGLGEPTGDLPITPAE